MQGKRQGFQLGQTGLRTREEKRQGTLNQDVINKMAKDLKKYQAVSRTKSSNEMQSKLIQKSKLLVHKKDNKFYIDHSAAYALKLINTRAVMLDKPHLIEIDMGTLASLQSNKEIDIEYVDDVNKNKKESNLVKDSDLVEELGKLKQDEYGIGVHGINSGNSIENENRAENILDEGLNINNKGRTILTTAISLGTNENPQKITEEITAYKFGNGTTRSNVVIAVPLSIQNKNGEKIFLGFPEENKRTAGQEYDEHCILDQICGSFGKIPSEFILGYYHENPDGTGSFVKNPQHYSSLGVEEREGIYQRLSENMNEISKKVNELINSGDFEKLGQMRDVIQQRGLKTYMIDNVLDLFQKDNKQENVKSNETTKNKFGKFFGKIIENTKLSDLRIAKKNLAKCIEDPKIEKGNKSIEDYGD